MTLYENECLAAGKDPEAVRKLARTLDRAAKQAEALGVKIFGGSGNGTIRSYDGDAQHPHIEWAGPIPEPEGEGDDY